MGGFAARARRRAPTPGQPWTVHERVPGNQSPNGDNLWGANPGGARHFPGASTTYTDHRAPGAPQKRSRVPPVLPSQSLASSERTSAVGGGGTGPDNN